MNTLTKIFAEARKTTTAKLREELARGVAAKNRQLMVDNGLRKRARSALKKATATLREVAKSVQPIFKALKSPNGEFNTQSPNHRLLTLRSVSFPGYSYIVCIRAPKPGARQARQRAVSVYYKTRVDMLFMRLPQDQLHELGVGMIDYLDSLATPENLVRSIAEAIARNTFPNHP